MSCEPAPPSGHSATLACTDPWVNGDFSAVRYRNELKGGRPVAALYPFPTFSESAFRMVSPPTPKNIYFYHK